MGSKRLRYRNAKEIHFCGRRDDPWRVPRTHFGLITHWPWVPIISGVFVSIWPGNALLPEGTMIIRGHPITCTSCSLTQNKRTKVFLTYFWGEVICSVKWISRNLVDITCPFMSFLGNVINIPNLKDCMHGWWNCAGFTSTKIILEKNPKTWLKCIYDIL